MTYVAIVKQSSEKSSNEKKLFSVIWTAFSMLGVMVFLGAVVVLLALNTEEPTPIGNCYDPPSGCQ